MQLPLQGRDVLLSFYDFPAEHWGHLQTTNPIETTFSTIRLRHRRTKGSGSRKTGLTMMFKLAQSASRRWRLLNGYRQIVLALEEKVFADGVLQNAACSKTAQTQLLTIALVIAV